MQAFWTQLGRLSFALAISCLLTGLWALIVGAEPAVAVTATLQWWPGSVVALPLGLLLYGVGRSLVRSEELDLIHRQFGTWLTPPVALGAAGILLILILIQWESGKLALHSALDMYLWAALCLAPLGPTMPPEPPAPAVRHTFLPDLRTERPIPPAGTDVEFAWWRVPSGDQARQHHSVRLTLPEAESDVVPLSSTPDGTWSRLLEPVPVIECLAYELRQISLKAQLAPYDELAGVLAFVQNGLGPLDLADVDPWPPEESLRRAKASPALGLGLRARTLLAAALVRAMGYDVTLLRAGAEQVAFGISGVYARPQLSLRIHGRPALLAQVLESDEFFLGDAAIGAPDTQWELLA